MKRKLKADAQWQPPPEWFASLPAGQENAVTGMGQIEHGGFTADVVRQPSWRRAVGLLLALALVLPIIGATVLLIIRFR